MRFQFDFPGGTLEICYNTREQWFLALDNVRGEYIYNSAESALENVMARHTGFAAWDAGSGVTPPCSLEKWRVLYFR